MTQHESAPGASRGATSQTVERDTPDCIGQISLDEALTAEQRRNAGAARAEHAAHPATREHVRGHLDALIDSGREFTADQLRDRTGAPPAASPNILGAAIMAAARAGRIECVGYRPSDRPEAHRRILRVWRGVVA